eukprot:scaffold8566_cov141-Isochrysis_galbana.AAC.3
MADPSASMYGCAADVQPGTASEVHPPAPTARVPAVGVSGSVASSEMNRSPAPSAPARATGSKHGPGCAAGYRQDASGIAE